MLKNVTITLNMTPYRFHTVSQPPLPFLPDAMCTFPYLRASREPPSLPLLPPYRSSKKDIEYYKTCRAKLEYQLEALRKKSSSLGPPLETSFSANCSSKLRNGSLSGSVCADPDVLAAPGVACCSYGVGILNIGSR